jgi:hypothetical protein
MKKFKVITAFATYKKGDLVSPTGLWRDHLQAYGYIAMHPEAPAQAPAVAPEPVPVAIEEDAPIETPETEAEAPAGDVSDPPKKHKGGKR